MLLRHRQFQPHEAADARKREWHATLVLPSPELSAWSFQDTKSSETWTA